MSKYGIENTHKALYQRLYEYINSQYFGSSILLQEAILPKIVEEGVLYRKPFVEANKAYETIANGITIDETEIPTYIKEFMSKMIESNLGVYKNPFSHQVKALESFYNNKDLFIATGTGSGKTECFMWPMISSIAEETYKRKNSWKMRGVRALLLYPMNALVSDQVGRLRRIIGDANGDFGRILKDWANDSELRMPQFGMYTGRTPYPGEKNSKKDAKLANAITKDILDASEEIKKELARLGKLPAKKDLYQFVESLKEGEHLTDKEDAELISRFEMQKNCPDILITNYSMLEYMLMRQRESSIWDETILWLNESEENKLLFIIDEAHMYRGSAGGEVALLIKRVMHRLRINGSKVRFILTSASMPHDSIEDEHGIHEFACSFTSKDATMNSYELIFGEDEIIPEHDNFVLKASDIIHISVDKLQGDESEKLSEINNFVKAAYKSDFEFKVIDEARDWLYNNLMQIKQFRLLLSTCRGNATAFDDLSEILFKDSTDDDSKHGTQIILAVATLARSKDEKVLFPSRLHMFFRGLKGVYACMNINCNHATAHEGVTIGKVYLDSYRETCECGGKIYELVNHRRCGGLFVKGFIDRSSNGKNFLWQKSGLLKSETLKEIHLYLPDQRMTKAELKHDLRNVDFKWLDHKTGILFDHEHEGTIKVVCSTNSKSKSFVEDGLITFTTCPKCSNKIGKRGLTDFSTKGNIPFFNIVNAQLFAQPQTIHEKEKLEKYPNAGRKVLLFSDSRQRAAVLAKDMTHSADDNAARQALVKAAIRLQNYKGRCEKSIDMLYPVFLQIACEDNVHYFYGSDEELFNVHVKKMREKIAFAHETGKKIRYERIITDFKNKPDLYIHQLLKLVCDNYQSLSDVALCWMEPSDEEYIEDVLYRLKKKDIELSDEELIAIVSSWCISVAKDSIALGEDIEESQRESIQKNDYGRYGISNDSKLQRGIMVALKERAFSEKQIDDIKNEIISEFASSGKKSEKKFIMTSKIALKYDENHQWYKCPKCSEVSAFSLWGICPCCGSNKLELMTEQEYEALSFWRKPVEEVIHNNAQIKSINTEEHTAQLSHKDQREEIWSTTENYEMRFQDVSIDKDMPVDVLSCTTTMEVGIDIGSLSAVALRNVPPMRENYQQRAGRAGRRNSSISTITTYAHNGPHDNWYFNHPHKIITGKVRKPWIDVGNSKLVKRHLFIVMLNDFYKLRNSSIDDTLTTHFFENEFGEFQIFLSEFSLSADQEKVLIPMDVKENKTYWKNELISSLSKLKDDVDQHPEKYDDNETKVTLLDSLFDEGLLPTYSFPKNVVGFYIENEKGKIVQKPDRALDIAISEYAPGRRIVVNKKSYKSGGIYSHSSKYRKGEKTFTKPAEAYFNDRNYFMPIYMCNDTKCDWFGIELPENETCPFCGLRISGGMNMLKPWGFAPENGSSSKESESDVEFSFAEHPCYSAPPKDDMVKTVFRNLKMANRYDEVITIINKGPDSDGFTVCRKCGAAVAGSEGFHGTRIRSPYKMYKTCKHEDTENVVLGHTFRTDMLVLQIEVDPRIVDTSMEGMWLKSATVSLAETLKLAASRLLDVEFNDIKVGYRVRYSRNKVYIDIFVYDSLSSGAGYAFEVANCLEELFNEAVQLLTGCNCERACHDCLKNFWNQREQVFLNRKDAIELLNWALVGEMATMYDPDKQVELFSTIKSVLVMDDEFSTVQTGENNIIVKYQDQSKDVLIIPSMYNKSNFTQRNDVVLSDKMIKYSLPKAYEQILE